MSTDRIAVEAKIQSALKKEFHKREVAQASNITDGLFNVAKIIISIKTSLEKADELVRLASSIV